MPDPGPGERHGARVTGRVVADLGDELDRCAIGRGRDGDPPATPSGTPVLPSPRRYVEPITTITGQA